VKRRNRDSGFGAFVRKYQVLLLVIVLVLLIGPAAVLIARSLLKGREEDREIAPFASHISEFLAAPKKGGAAGQKVRPPVLPIDTRERRVDRLYFELPKSLRATSADAVATVVWLEWREQEVGEYSKGVPACVEFCEVTVIDRAQWAVVAEKEFKGGDPPKAISQNLSKGVGPRPYKEITDYVTSLCGG
jgi:hypothetical protein